MCFESRVESPEEFSNPRELLTLGPAAMDPMRSDGLGVRSSLMRSRTSSSMGAIGSPTESTSDHSISCDGACTSSARVNSKVRPSLPKQA